MLGLTLDERRGAPRILCIGAHCDDVEIGCGATLRQIARRYPAAIIHWLVLTSTPERRAEVAESAGVWCGPGRVEVTVLAHRDGFLPYDAMRVKTEVAKFAAGCDVDLVLTHQRDDRHQDHRLASELTWNHFRDHLILEYEVPKFDGDLGQPNLFVPVTLEDVSAKADDILRIYRSQRSKEWLTAETLLAVARLRGIECRSATGYAEGFYVRKAVVGFQV